ncbi:GntR family transcriptional regulator [uncultured Mailhella sp.]|uniref:GntR family transcriptional regulator n=1 Tax=uncultured Mailhella sp. TaxID=1981031 RepID=UPI0025EB9BD6|nr:GntR family transcriptional regulator [uncultured Mailhella sp.]
MKTSTVKSLQAYELIRELILQGELLPGARLVLADLEEKLQVGRGPIREALMRLDRSGLIRNLPYKGAVVAPLPTVREIRHIYELRVHLECLLATEAMKYADDKHCEDIEEILHGMEQAAVPSATLFHADRAFHAALYKAAAMPHLLDTADTLVDHVEIFLHHRCYAAQDQKTLLEQHREIFDAFQKKDEARLCESLTNNILMGLRLIQKEMERRGKQCW